MAEADMPRVTFIDLLPPAADPADELRAGLAAAQARIAPKFFYDALGCRLFEAICELPEYTLPRDEAAIMRRHLRDIARRIGTGGTLIDVGAGNCAKAERLFDALRPRQYVAVDIAAHFLRAQLDALAQRHGSIDVVGLATDFSHGLVLPAGVAGGRRVVFYAGSSIGNFGAVEAAALLAGFHATCDGGHLLLGADLVKDEAAMVAAYDDALGVTAAFNLNVLRVVNRLAGSDFDLAGWRHVALYDAEHGRIEMHLEARRHMVVTWPGGERRFAAGERIHTENCGKYTLEGLTGMLRDAGFDDVVPCMDAAQRFAVLLAS